MRLVIVTGISGAGKVTALKIFEDNGYYCVDNLPIDLIESFADILFGQTNEKNKVAIGVDIRSGKNLEKMSEVLKNMKAKEQNYEAFYGQEIEYRKLMRYPPVWNMLYILCASKNEMAAGEAAMALMERIGQAAKESSEGIYPIGPSDAPVAKISDVYRKVIYVKTKEYRTLVLLKDKLEGFMKDNRLYQNVAVGFDFNPINGF